MTPNRNNLEIRGAAKRGNVRLWEVAERMNMSEWTLSRRLRHELPEEEKQRLLEIIEELKR